MANQRRNRGHIGDRVGKKCTTYFFSVYCGRHPDTNKKLYWRKGKFATLEEVEIGLLRALAEFLQNGIPNHILKKGLPDEDAVNGIVHDPVPEDPTVEEWIRYWDESHVQNLKPSTRLQYRRSARLYLVPMLGTWMLEGLTRRHIQAMVNKLRKSVDQGGRGLAPRTVRLVVAALGSAMSMAVQDGPLVENPCKGVRLPKISRRRPRLSNAEAANAVLRKAKNSKWYPALVLVAHTGMRRGEAMALVWMSVNFRKGVLTVDSNRTIGDEGVVEVSPKTDSSVRSIELGKTVLTALRDQQKRQKHEFAQLGLKWSDHVHVFTNPSGKPYNPGRLTRVFKKFAIAAGYPDATLHHLRHAHASILLKASVSIADIAERLGHDSASTTIELYVHPSPEADQEAAEIFDARMMAVEGDADGDEDEGAETGDGAYKQPS